MKIRIFSILFILSVFLAPLRVQGKIFGYLSFEYLKGQEQTNVTDGSFRKSQLGLIFSDEIAPRINYAAEFRLREENRIELDQAWVGFNLSTSLNFK